MLVPIKYELSSLESVIKQLSIFALLKLHCDKSRLCKQALGIAQSEKSRFVRSHLAGPDSKFKQLLPIFSNFDICNLSPIAPVFIFLVRSIDLYQVSKNSKYYNSNGISITYSETIIKISISYLRNVVFNKVLFSLIS